jgi:hypothetical protein
MGHPFRPLAVLIGVLAASVAGTAWAAHGSEVPVVTGTAAQDITSSRATLKGTVNPNGKATTYLFEYGPTAAYGSQTPEGSAGQSKSAVPVTAAVSGLAPDTIYHFRLVADSGKGTTRGPDKTFTTLPAPSDPGGDPGSDPGSDPGLKVSTGAPEPRLGRSVLIAPTAGELRVRMPGTDHFVPLELGSRFPVGAEIDASHGSLALTAALPKGKTETGYFGAGRFTFKQDKRGYVDLYLRGRYCSRASTAGVASAARKRKPGRKLWGRDHGGRFRTHGRNSHATVRGTRWLVADTCKGTYTRVSRGSVVVRDTVRRKRIVLKAGEHYLARPRH